MSWTVPTFPIICDIYTGPWLTKVIRTGAVACNLGMGRRIALPVAIGPAVPLQAEAQLLLPALTDVRDNGCVSGYDVIECPQGSGRWYWVIHVEDAGKGFANEHRVAWLGKAVQAANPIVFAGSFWPTPIP